MQKKLAQEVSQAKLSARQNRMGMANEGVKALLAINGAGAGSMLTLLQFILQQSIGPKTAAVIALACFASGMFVAALINFARVQSSLAHAGGTEKKNFWFWFHRAMTAMSALAFFIGSAAVVFGYATS